MKKFAWLVSVVLLMSCSLDDPGYYSSFSLLFDFSESDYGWTGDFADYPEGDSVFYELDVSYETLPEVINSSGERKGFFVTGDNHSDDLFMFLTEHITGLRPNTSYELYFSLTIGSNAPTGSVGAGGSPGESVYVKAGATTYEPKKVLQGGSYVMNLDKGNQSESGDDMFVLGNIGVSSTTTDYKEIARNNTGSPFIITTDEDGDIWVIVGTDSGFEGTTSIYYTKIQVLFNQLN